MNNTERAYKMSVGYGTRTLEWKGERSGVIHFRRDFLVPAFHEGVIERALVITGAKSASVRGKQVGPLDADYSVSWEE